MRVAVRPALPSDAAGMARVHVQSWRETYPGLVPQTHLDRQNEAEHEAMWRLYTAEPLPGRSYFVGLADSEIVALAGAGPLRPPSIDSVSGEFMLIYVLQRAQRLGLGKLLMDAMARHLVATGHTTAALWVISGNAQARAFYESLGGTYAGEHHFELDGQSIPEAAYAFELRALRTRLKR